MGEQETLEDWERNARMPRGIKVNHTERKEYCLMLKNRILLEFASKFLSHIDFFIFLFFYFDILNTFPLYA